MNPNVSSDKINLNRTYVRGDRMYNRTIKRRIKFKKKGRNILLIFMLIIFFSFYFSLTCLREGQAIGNTDSHTRIVVKRGDTLWNLAEKYSSKNQDIRKTVYEIKKINNLSDQYLMPGKLLIIP